MWPGGFSLRQHKTGFGLQMTTYICCALDVEVDWDTLILGLSESFRARVSVTSSLLPGLLQFFRHPPALTILDCSFG